MTDQLEVYLQSADGQGFTILKRDIVPCSKTLHDLIEDVTVTSPEDPIPLPNVSSKILIKIVEYCKQHASDPVPCKTEEETDTKKKKVAIPKETSWDEEFMRDLDLDTVMDLIVAANYLDIGNLLELGANYLSKAVTGKTTVEVFKYFGVEPIEITPELEKECLAENPWMETK
jgi:S-phase kinase-associated protein 1